MVLGENKSIQDLLRPRLGTSRLLDLPHSVDQSKSNDHARLDRWTGSLHLMKGFQSRIAKGVDTGKGSKRRPFTQSFSCNLLCIGPV